VDQGYGKEGGKNRYVERSETGKDQRVCSFLKGKSRVLQLQERGGYFCKRAIETRERREPE